MAEYSKSYRLKYEVHCKLQNFFGKEMVIKNCMSKMHAKAKLDTYCRKKYGIEYQCVIVNSVSEEDFLGMYEDLLGCKDKSTGMAENLIEMIKNIKNKK